VAASLAGYRRILVPKANEPDWAEVSAEAKRALDVVFVETVDDVLRHALLPSPVIERLLSEKEDAPTSEGLPGFAH
jgi:ATP-dependent Lon protease